MSFCLVFVGAVDFMVHVSVRGEREEVLGCNTVLATGRLPGGGPPKRRYRRRTKKFPP